MGGFEWVSLKKKVHLQLGDGYEERTLKKVPDTLWQSTPADFWLEGERIGVQRSTVEGEKE